MLDEWQEWLRKRRLKEQATPTEPVKRQKCPEDEEWSDELHQCVKKKKSAPVKPVTEQIPAQPVVPVGPVTIEQKVAALNDKLAHLEKMLANLYGLTGHSIQEVETVLAW